jgi:lipopolysaccharide biosynthesis regulator YciM
MQKKGTYAVVKRSSDAELIFNVLGVLRKNGEVVGEMKFLQLLKKRDTGVSPRRLRKIIYEIPEIEVSVKYSKSKFKNLDRCPVCSTKLTTIKEVNLEGKRKIVGYRCEVCGFNSTSNGKPYIYSFRLKNYDL